MGATIGTRFGKRVELEFDCAGSGEHIMAVKARWIRPLSIRPRRAGLTWSRARRAAAVRAS
jgi:hypothetical protein